MNKDNQQIPTLKMTQMLELSDKNFKVTIIKMLQGETRNTLETKADKTTIIYNTFMTDIGPL